MDFPVDIYPKVHIAKFLPIAQVKEAPKEDWWL
jgi:hypothetical protein